MAGTRPFEGLALIVALAASVLVWLHGRHRRPDVFRQFALKTVLPGLSVATIGLVPVALEMRAVTGSPFRWPHEVYRRQMAIWPTFAFQPVKTQATYRHEVIRQFFEEWEPEYEDAKEWGTVRGLLPGIKGRLRTVGACYFPLAPYLPVALLSLSAVVFRKTRVLGAVICVSLVGANALVNWLVPHYLAPILGAMMAIHLQFLRFVRTRMWRGRPLGRRLFAGIMVFLLLLFAIRFAQRVGVNRDAWALARKQVHKELEVAPGRHMILVQYDPHHLVTEEWVFNGPDIAGEKIVWARSMTPELDQELVDNYRDRRIWILKADASPPALTPRNQTRGAQ